MGPEVEVLVVVHADRHVARQGALLRRRRGRREVAAAAVVAVPPAHDLKKWSVTHHLHKIIKG